MCFHISGVVAASAVSGNLRPVHDLLSALVVAFRFRQMMQRRIKLACSAQSV
jgi:hypothetical protein